MLLPLLCAPPCALLVVGDDLKEEGASRQCEGGVVALGEGRMCGGGENVGEVDGETDDGYPGSFFDDGRSWVKGTLGVKATLPWANQ